MIWPKIWLIDTFNKIDDNQIIKLTEIRENRSQQQNRLMWQWLGDLQKCFNEKGIFITCSDLHEGLRDKLIKWTYHKNIITWRRVVKRKSTSELNKKEFSEYLKDIEKYLWQTYEISYPMPTDVFYNKK